LFICIIYIVQSSVVPGSSVPQFQIFQFYVANSSVVPGSVMAVPYSGGIFYFSHYCTLGYYFSLLLIIDWLLCGLFDCIFSHCPNSVID